MIKFMNSKTVLINSEDLDVVKKLLEDNNIYFEDYNSPLEAFCYEEAEFRLRSGLEDKKSKDEIDQIIDEHKFEIGLLLYQDDGMFLDTDFIENEVIAYLKSKGIW